MAMTMAYANAAPALSPPAHALDCPSLTLPPERVSLFGTHADPLTMGQTVDAVRAMLRCGRPHQHVCLNAAKLVDLQGDGDLLRAVSQCDLISVDGQAVVWASQFLGCRVPERVAGIDLFFRLLGEASKSDLPVYLLGAREPVVTRCAAVAQARWPGLRIVGARSGYWPPEQESEVVADIARSGARLLFVGIPSPHKEIFLEQHAETLRVPFRMGVGGSFDVLAGVTRRAPLWAQRAGMEWCYRLFQEPRRMARRYLVGNARFLWMTCRARLSR